MYDLNIYEPLITIIVITFIYHIQLHERELPACVCAFVFILHIPLSDTQKEFTFSRINIFQEINIFLRNSYSLPGTLDSRSIHRLRYFPKLTNFEVKTMHDIKGDNFLYYLDENLADPWRNLDPYRIHIFCLVSHREFLLSIIIYFEGVEKLHVINQNIM